MVVNKNGLLKEPRELWDKIENLLEDWVSNNYDPLILILLVSKQMEEVIE